MNTMRFPSFNYMLNVIFCSLLLRNMVFGMYLPDSTGDKTEKIGNKTGALGPRSMGLNKENLWPGSIVNGKWIVKVPYLNNLDPEVYELFLTTVKMFEQRTCIRWVPRTNEQHYVRVFSGLPEVKGYSKDRCYAYVGQKMRIPSMYLSRECVGLAPNSRPRMATVAHEMMHSLNMEHEHIRKDRNCYVEIPAETVNNDYFNNGIIKTQETDLTYPYDEDSVMHYRDPNIKSKFNKQLGAKNDAPSEMDWIKVNNHYCGGKHYCNQQNPAFDERCRQHAEITRRCYGQGYKTIKYKRWPHHS